MERKIRGATAMTSAKHFNLKNIFLTTVILFFTGPSAFASGAPTLHSIDSNEAGLKQLKQQNYLGAQQNFIEGLSDSPFTGELHLNLGLTFEQNQNAEKALQSYSAAEKYAQNPETKFRALFNQAQLVAKSGDKPRALSLYQQALSIKPDSFETKANIELLTKDDQKQGGGGGQNNQDQKNNKDDKNSKDKKDDQNNKDQNKDPNKDKKDKDGKDKDKGPPKQDPKPSPPKFKGEQLNEQDVKKIFGEIKQQEQKIRAEFQKTEVKERPRDKDW